ncbi:MAG: Lrp/AsnC family transcriptional regulator [Gammaproteobacteria bacterium]|nr:Lrp/AsnC family transcriptional regulator [Gammaproteobacteria bacterium]NIR98588.1 Lrp/AsnC family transcriptional regulator [Gammaproteobacteria bacterium]NIT64311.1 Lrp/AsnC family transcriptional regulator [Gammaproteobacteria bacterium]NIV21235.1 AsnC family transcriptional regulator [Gammaproteobacteria bacterium]NIX10939.1 AsnC family transcriptional regulator [Gammaproteobacteria bacterium]
MDLKDGEFGAGVVEGLTLDAGDRAVVAAIQGGLPLVPRPYAALGAQLGMDEGEVMDRIRRLASRGYIKRLGVVVRHHELGYRANAMVVWDIPDERVAALGPCMGRFEFVTLCYRRPRRLPHWPYNMFCMIHGRDRASVLANVDEIVGCCGLHEIPRAVLFSRRRFKQRGAVYYPGAERAGERRAAAVRG